MEVHFEEDVFGRLLQKDRVVSVECSRRNGSVEVSRHC
jgi:hypothetical protein